MLSDAELMAKCAALEAEVNAMRPVAEAVEWCEKNGVAIYPPGYHGRHEWMVQNSDVSWDVGPTLPLAVAALRAKVGDTPRSK